MPPKVNLRAWGVEVVNVPSSDSFTNLSSNANFGTRTLLKDMKPWSEFLKPILGPISPMLMPGKGECVFESLIWITNAYTPWS